MGDLFGHSHNTHIDEWDGLGSHHSGPDKDGVLYCLGGCGGIIGYIPSYGQWANINLSWCCECADRYREDTGEDPCFPRHIRELEVFLLIRKQYERRDKWDGDPRAIPIR